MDRQKVDDVNNWHIGISDRTNTVLGIILIVLLIVYSVSGIITFLPPKPHLVPFIIGYMLWTAVGIYILIRYRDDPLKATSLYLLVIGLDRVISCFNYTFEMDLSWLLEVLLSVWMFVSGIMWARGRVLSRYPLILSTALLTCYDVQDLIFIALNVAEITDTTEFLLCFATFNRILMYAVLLAILLCNTTPNHKSGSAQNEI
jgi:hypothetical protein